MGWPGPTTHRQFLAWNEWLDRQWNRPSRADHYAMQAAASNSSKRVTSLKAYVIRFEEAGAKKKDRQTDAAAASAVAKSVWLARLAGSDRPMEVEHRTISRAEAAARDGDTVGEAIPGATATTGDVEDGLGG